MAQKKDKDAGTTKNGQDCKSAGDENVKGQKLIDEACKAYGIDKKYVFSSGYHPETDEAVIVTNGGAKVRYRKGDKVEPLPAVRVDGIVRKKMRVIAGKKR